MVVKGRRDITCVLVGFCCIGQSSDQIMEAKGLVKQELIVNTRQFGVQSYADFAVSIDNKLDIVIGSG